MEQDKAKLAEMNAKESQEALRLAEEQKARDRAAGIPTNPAELTSHIAKSVQKKLENDDFSVVVDDATGQHVPPRRSTQE
jgi:hypothetical protein